MSAPKSIGELSRYALNEAVKRIGRELRDADQETRDAIETIKLVVDVPRETPWYGVPMDAEDSSVTVGVVLRNLIETLDVIASREAVPAETRRLCQQEAARLKRRTDRGKRAYNEYLDNLYSHIDPALHEERR
jgi:hypothetical protein